jgi:hypothetical protein
MAQASGQAEEDGGQARDEQPRTPQVGVAAEAQSPIVALVDDLFVSARIDAAAEAIGREVRYPRSADEFRSLLHQGPAAILVGMAATRLPWADLIREAKADPRTGGTYVLAFGPHKNLELRRQALEAGADRVIANSAFTRALPTLLGAPRADVPEDEGR